MFNSLWVEGFDRACGYYPGESGGIGQIRKTSDAPWGTTPVYPSQKWQHCFSKMQKINDH